MKLETRRTLRELAEARGKEYGKLIQKFLALAFLDVGATQVYERSTQGIDLELTLDLRSLAIEVKTCEGRTLRLGKKDLEGLEARAESGADTYLAVLGPGLLDDWRFTRVVPGEIVAQRDILLVELRAMRDAELEERIHDPFQRVLTRFVGRARSEGQSGLDAVLSSHPEYRRA